ncbi:hypothetical protein I2A86_002780 [Staphylococcus aureus]|nr:hypothetical protein [Staphylococcus aureus]
MFEDRFPSLDELKNAEGNIVVLSNKSTANEGNVTFKSSGAITNAKRHKKSYSLDNIMAAGGMRAAGYKTLVVHVYS